MKGWLVVVALVCAFFVLRACDHRAESARASTASAPTLPPVQDLRETKPPEVATCVTAIAAQSDPAQIATLGRRQASPRLKRIIYYLAAARDAGADPAAIIDQAQKANGSAGTSRAPLVKASLLRNLKICDGLQLLDPVNRALLRRGYAPTVRRGPYLGQVAEVDHIVPLAQAPEIGNELANLEIQPSSLNRAKGSKVGERQLDLARSFRAAGMISEATMANVQAKFIPSGTGKDELQGP